MFACTQSSSHCRSMALQQKMRPTLPYGGIGTAWVDDDV